MVSEEAKEKVEYLEGEVKKAMIIQMLLTIFTMAFITISMLFLRFGKYITFGTEYFSLILVIFILPVSIFISYIMVKKVFDIEPIESLVNFSIAKREMKHEEWERSEVERKAKLVYIFYFILPWIVAPFLVHFFFFLI